MKAVIYVGRVETVLLLWRSELGGESGGGTPGHLHPGGEGEGQGLMMVRGARSARCEMNVCDANWSDKSARRTQLSLHDQTIKKTIAWNSLMHSQEAALAYLILPMRSTNTPAQHSYDTLPATGFKPTTFQPLAQLPHFLSYTPPLNVCLTATHHPLNDCLTATYHFLQMKTGPSVPTAPTQSIPGARVRKWQALGRVGCRLRWRQIWQKFEKGNPR